MNIRTNFWDSHLLSVILVCLSALLMMACYTIPITDISFVGENQTRTPADTLSAVEKSLYWIGWLVLLANLVFFNQNTRNLRLQALTLVIMSYFAVRFTLFGYQDDTDVGIVDRLLTLGSLVFGISLLLVVIAFWRFQPIFHDPPPSGMSKKEELSKKYH